VYNTISKKNDSKPSVIYNLKLSALQRRKPYLHVASQLQVTEHDSHLARWHFGSGNLERLKELQEVAWSLSDKKERDFKCKLILTSLKCKCLAINSEPGSVGAGLTASGALCGWVTWLGADIMGAPEITIYVVCTGQSTEILLYFPSAQSIKGVKKYLLVNWSGHQSG